MDAGGTFRVGSHSKGGNLALFSALHCDSEKQARLLEVYNFDGPGLSTDIVPSDRFKPILDKLVWIIPGYSIIGTLFPCEKKPLIIESDGNGFMQHDALTWMVDGSDFIMREDLLEDCKFYVKIFDEWINSADIDQRSMFTKEFFGALRASGAKTMKEVMGGGIDGFGTVLLSIVNSESRTKIVIGKFIKSIIFNCRSINWFETLKSRQTLKSGIVLSVGLLIMRFPDDALHLTGIITGIFLILLCGRKLISNAIKDNLDTRQKKFRILSCMAGICAVEFLIANKSAILFSSHLILGIMLMILAFYIIYNAGKQNLSLFQNSWRYLLSVSFCILGLIALTMKDQEIALMYALGIFSVSYGLIALLLQFYRNGKSNTEK